MAETILRHVECLLRLKHALVERHETADVLRQKRRVVYALDESIPCAFVQAARRPSQVTIPWGSCAPGETDLAAVPEGCAERQPS